MAYPHQQTELKLPRRDDFPVVKDEGIIESFHDDANQAMITMCGDIIDDTPLSRGAQVIFDIMHEFLDDEEPFQPSRDAELKAFIAAVLEREVPEMTQAERDYLLDEMQDFPPVKETLEAAVAPESLTIAA